MPGYIKPPLHVPINTSTLAFIITGSLVLFATILYAIYAARKDAIASDESTSPLLNPQNDHTESIMTVTVTF